MPRRRSSRRGRLSETDTAAELGTRDRLVVTAAELMRRRGYAATGIKTILAASDVPSGSLYHFFPAGKEQLAAEAVRVSGAAYRELVEAYFQPGADFVSAVRAFFDDAADVVESTGFVDACPIAAIALETANDSPAIRGAAADAFASWLAILQARALESGVSAKAAKQLAEELFMLLQGAFLLARVLRDADLIRRAAATAATLAAYHL